MQTNERTTGSSSSMTNHLAQKILAVLLLLSISTVHAWTTAPATTSFTKVSALARRPTSLERLRPLSFPLSQTPLSSQAVSVDSDASLDTEDDDDDTNNKIENNNEEEDDDDEYEYVEFDSLAEADFAGSEWLVGTVFEGKENKPIQETWCRLFVTEEGKNLAFWGDNSEGTWNFDVASQFLTLSKDTLFGKRIWACTTDDFYYLQGTVRGWTYLQSARVLAQWQARRLGVDAEEAGIAPWFEEQDEEDEDDSEETAAAPISEGIFGSAEGIFGSAKKSPEETTEA
jgi:hypothetical protein